MSAGEQLEMDLTRFTKDFCEAIAGIDLTCLLEKGRAVSHVDLRLVRAHAEPNRKSPNVSAGKFGNDPLVVPPCRRGLADDAGEQSGILNGGKDRRQATEAQANENDLVVRAGDSLDPWEEFLDHESGECRATDEVDVPVCRLTVGEVDARNILQLSLLDKLIEDPFCLHTLQVKFRIKENQTPTRVGCERASEPYSADFAEGG